MFIRIGGIIFWIWIIYMFFGFGGDDKDKKVEKTTDESTITSKIKEAFKNVLDIVKKETNKLINFNMAEYLEDQPPDLKENIDKKKEKKDNEPVKEKEVKKNKDELLKLYEKPKINPEPIFRKL